MKTKTTIKTSIKCIDSTEGEPIENCVARMLKGNEKVEITRIPIYTKKSDGVLPQYNIRTDRFEVAQDMMSFASKQRIAKREEYYKQQTTSKEEGQKSQE